eukprot:TRINITY_DN1333_c0_g1_i1.p1 TRINITY_DN1333_c0_g1~~TRINITY_DN1333_c0_g1_i1.p1  ORF type:complete len:181 (+),score=35.41 TRINITY_DN1333_c0_g1_i1:61-603(+)
MAHHPEPASSSLLASATSKKEWYGLLLESATGLCDGEPNHIANCANLSSLFYQAYLEQANPSRINWFGFYLVDRTKTNELVLGPFQGKVACIRIPFGKGVCGTACSEMKTQVVPDVHAFPGHIACDSVSESEVVVPVVDRQGRLVGVLDVDSPLKNNFDEEDVSALEALAEIVGKASEWP